MLVCVHLDAIPVSWLTCWLKDKFLSMTKGIPDLSASFYVCIRGWQVLSDKSQTGHVLWSSALVACVVSVTTIQWYRHRQSVKRSPNTNVFTDIEVWALVNNLRCWSILFSFFFFSSIENLKTLHTWWVTQRQVDSSIWICSLCWKHCLLKKQWPHKETIKSLLLYKEDKGETVTVLTPGAQSCLVL